MLRRSAVSGTIDVMSRQISLDSVPSTRNRAALDAFLTDESSSYRGSADVAYFPRTETEMAAVLSHASSKGTRVTFSGGGTAITGAGVPPDGAVISTERLRRVDTLMLPDGTTDWETVGASDFSIRFSRDARRAVVPAGVRLFELNHALERSGLYYPPDPTEASAMIGGTVATNASGARSYCYGPTRRWVSGLLVVSSSGECGWVRRGEWVASSGELEIPSWLGTGRVPVSPGLSVPPTKNASGLHLVPDVDVVDLIVGSEGILCGIAAVLVDLADRPVHVVQVASFFPSQAAALDAADSLRGTDGLLSIEYFDPAALDFMRADHPDLPSAPTACVLFEFPFAPLSNANPYPSANGLRRWEALLSRLGEIEHWAVTGAEIEAMKGFRHSLPEQVNRWVSARVGKLGTDMAVPERRFREMVDAYETARSRGVRSVLFGHLGQFHLHLNFLPEDEDELARAKELYRDLARFAVKLGGTISAEHGVGKKRLYTEDGDDHPYLWYMYGDEGLWAISQAKAVFDPNWILNPGTMVPTQ